MLVLRRSKHITTQENTSGDEEAQTTRAASLAHCKSTEFSSRLLAEGLHRSAIEILIESGFKPSRTIVLAFGFDEETSGLEGANKLADAMLDIYGEDAFDFIIDEGGALPNNSDSFPVLCIHGQ